MEEPQAFKALLTSTWGYAVKRTQLWSYWVREKLRASLISAGICHVFVEQVMCAVCNARTCTPYCHYSPVLVDGPLLYRTGFHKRFFYHIFRLRFEISTISSISWKHFHINADQIIKMFVQNFTCVMSYYNYLFEHIVDDVMWYISLSKKIKLQISPLDVARYISNNQNES